MNSEEQNFRLVVHYGETLTRDPIEYHGGIIERIVDIDIDRWGFQNLRELMKNLDYTEECKYWWHQYETDELIEIWNDDIAMCIGHTAMESKERTEQIYVEHSVGEMRSVETYLNEGDTNRSFQDMHEVAVNGCIQSKQIANKIVEGVNEEIDDDSEFDASYHPIAGSDSDPDDEFDKYTDFVVENRSEGVSYSQMGNQDIEAGYESDCIDPYVNDSDNESNHQLSRIRYKSRMMRAEFKFEVGMEFSTLNEFKEAIRDWNILNGRSVKLVKNDKVRVRAVCKDKSCQWLVFLSKVKNTKAYLVKTVNMVHTCEFVYENKTANAAWVAKTILDDVSRNLKYKLKSIVQKMGKDANIGISLVKAQRAKKRALNALIGTQKEQYAKLWNYLEEMKTASNGNTCGLLVEAVPWSPRPLFQRIYVCLEACKKGFLTACRPFIGVDGCFLTGEYGGQLLTAVGVDPNDQYFPIAWAIVEVENTDSWRWFMNLLLQDIGSVKENGWIFMSDQQKGLLKVFDEVLDGMEHRFCLRHMYNNFRKKWPGGEFLLLIEAAARSTYEVLFNKKMVELKNLSVHAYNWLMSVPKSCWCRHAFSSHVQCDSLLNNVCESFNGRLLPGRYQGPIGLLEFMRCYVMDKFIENRNKAERYKGHIMPKIKSKFEKRIASSFEWIARAVGYEIWEVSNAYGKRHVVDLNKFSCSCGSFQLCGIPCAHAVKAINYKSGAIESYVSNRYSKESYVACYSPIMSPIRGEEFWPVTPYPHPLPPPMRRRSGRPKKLRRRDPMEDSRCENNRSRKMSRKSMYGRCGKCGEMGHNRRTCKIGDESFVDQGSTEVIDGDGNNAM